jgi:O-antigen/teichoic acid export membrane protein
MRNTVPMVALTINSIAWTVAVVLIDRLDAGLVSLALAMTAITAVTTLGQAVCAMRLVTLRRPRPQTIRRLVGEGTPLALATVIVVAYGRIDQFLVFTIAGSDEAGLYGAVYKVFDSWAFIPGSLIITLGPVFAASWPRDRGRLLRASRLAVEYLTVGSLGIVAFTIGAADPLVRFLFGNDFAAAAPALPVMAGAFVMMSYGYLTDNLLLVIGKQRRLLPIALVGLVVNLAANLVLIPTHGFLGAAWATLATETIVEVCAVIVLLRTLGIRRFNVDRLARTGASSVVLVIVLVALREGGASLLVLAVTAAVVYPLLLIALRALRLDELLAITFRRRAPA